MIDRCAKCGRPKSTSHVPDRLACHAGMGTDDTYECWTFAEGRRAGMREAIEVAKRLARVTNIGGDWDVEYAAVDSEIARRLGDA